MINNITVNRSISLPLRSRLLTRLRLCVGLALVVVILLSVLRRPQAARAPLTAQAQIDAAPAGGVVVLPAGSFPEQLVIDKDLTLMGAGPSTVIQAPETLGDSFAVGSTTYSPVIYVHDAADVTIQNLRVDGRGLGNGYDSFVGIAFENAGGRVDSVEVTGIHDTPWSSASHHALYAYADTAAPRLYVTHCDFDGFQKNGVVFWGEALTAQVSNNTITGQGPTDLAVQNGIVVGPGVTGIVGPSNIVSDIVYLPGSPAASGILIFSSDAAVFHNVISDSHVGIYLYEGGGDIFGNRVTAAGDVAEPWGIVAVVGGVTASRSIETEVRTPPVPSTGAGMSEDVAVEATRAVTATINVTSNTLVGDGANLSATGLQIEGLCGAEDITFSLGDNAIGGWGDGVVLYVCDGVQYDFVAQQNAIEGNLTYGMRATGFDVGIDASANWWGHNSGPYDGSDADGFYNPEGQGDAVSDGVNYVPWLRKTFLPLVLRG